jgi:dihydropteroate synthase
VDGVSRFEDLRARAVEMDVGGSPLLVAALADVISDVLPVGNPRGASSHVAPARRSVSSRKPAARKKRRQPSALRRESDRALMEQIRRLLALPMNQRTHFLRKRRGLVGSSI